MTNSTQDIEFTCQLFVDSVNNYFSHLTPVKSQTSVPFLKDPDKVILKDFTGMIGISGNRQGFVYISGDKYLFDELVKHFLKPNSVSKNDLMDMAGEVANVVSGNVREAFGKEFMISVPIVFEGRPEHLKFPEDVPVYVVPIKWSGYEAVVVIGIK